MRKAIRGLDKEVLLVILLILTYTVSFSYLSWLRYATFRATALDLGLFKQSFWTTLHGGGIFCNTIEGGSHFRIHLSPIVFLLLPLYALYPKTITLLVAQTLAIALGSIPLFLMAKRELGSEEAVMMTAIYFSYPPLWGVNLFDWHPVAFAIPLLMATFYFFSEKRYGLYAVFAALSLACKETVALPILLLGFYGLWEHKERLAGSLGLKFWKSGSMLISLGTIGAALAWLALSFAIPSPPHYSILPHYYGYLGNSLGQALSNAITNPALILKHLFRRESFLYLILTLGPLAFLPLLAPRILGITGPTYLAILLCERPIQAPDLQYPSTLIPFLFISAVYGVSKVGKVQLKRMLFVSLAACIISAGFVVTTDQYTNFSETRPPSPHDKVMKRLIDKIPDHASVLTTSTYFTHLANRKNAYCLSPNPAATRTYPENVEFILLDPKSLIKVPPSFEPLRKVMDSNDYGIYAFADGAELLKRHFRGKPQAIEPPPQGSLEVIYYADDNFQKEVYTSATTCVSFNWGEKAPISFMPKDHFTILWRGHFYAPLSGQYTFWLTSDDGNSLSIDGKEIFNGIHQKLYSNSAEVHLKKGWHSIEIRFWEWEGKAMINLKWKRPGTSKLSEIPSEYFSRPSKEKKST